MDPDTKEEPMDGHMLMHHARIALDDLLWFCTGLARCPAWGSLPGLNYPRGPPCKWPPLRGDWRLSPRAPPRFRQKAGPPGTHRPAMPAARTHSPDAHHL